MASKGILGILALLLLVVGGYVAYTKGLILMPHDTSSGVVVEEKTPGEMNAVFVVDGTQVMFVNGIATPPPGSTAPLNVHYFGNEVMGDLNADGIEDSAYLITSDGGGSGTFYYLVAALKTSTGYQGSNAVLLGDRIAPQTTELDRSNPADPRIIVNYADRGADEPMSAQPSVGTSRSFHVVNGILEEVK